MTSSRMGDGGCGDFWDGRFMNGRMEMSLGVELAVCTCGRGRDVDPLCSLDY